MSAILEQKTSLIKMQITFYGLIKTEFLNLIEVLIKHAKNQKDHDSKKKSY